MSTNKRLVSGSQIAATATTYYTTPANTKAKITAFTLCNTTGTNRTVDVHLVPSGGSADATNQVVDALAINANTSVIVSEAIGHVLEASGTIQCTADAATAVTLVVSGIEY